MENSKPHSFTMRYFCVLKYKGNIRSSVGQKRNLTGFGHINPKYVISLSLGGWQCSFTHQSTLLKAPWHESWKNSGQAKH